MNNDTPHPHEAMILAGLTLGKDWEQNRADHAKALAVYRKTPEFIALVGVTQGASSEPDLKRALDALNSAQLIPVVPVIGNSDTSQIVRPALVLGTFSPDAEALGRIALLAANLAELYNAPPETNPLRAALQRLVQDDQYVQGKRTLLPPMVSDGLEIFAFNALLPYQTREDGRLLMLAVPGAGPAPVVVLPAEVWEGKTSTEFGRRTGVSNSTQFGSLTPRKRSPIVMGCGILIAIWALVMFCTMIADKLGWIKPAAQQKR